MQELNNQQSPTGKENEDRRYYYGHVGFEDSSLLSPPSLSLERHMVGSRSQSPSQTTNFRRTRGLPSLFSSSNSSTSTPNTSLGSLGTSATLNSNYTNPQHSVIANVSTPLRSSAASTTYSTEPARIGPSSQFSDPTVRLDNTTSALAATDRSTLSGALSPMSFPSLAAVASNSSSPVRQRYQQERAAERAESSGDIHYKLSPSARRRQQQQHQTTTPDRRFQPNSSEVDDSYSQSPSNRMLQQRQRQGGTPEKRLHYSPSPSTTNDERPKSPSARLNQQWQQTQTPEIVRRQTQTQVQQKQAQTPERVKRKPSGQQPLTSEGTRVVSNRDGADDSRAAQSSAAKARTPERIRHASPETLRSAVSASSTQQRRTPTRQQQQQNTPEREAEPKTGTVLITRQPSKAYDDDQSSNGKRQPSSPSSLSSRSARRRGQPRSRQQNRSEQIRKHYHRPDSKMTRAKRGACFGEAGGEEEKTSDRSFSRFFDPYNSNLYKQYYGAGEENSTEFFYECDGDIYEDDNEEAAAEAHFLSQRQLRGSDELCGNRATSQQKIESAANESAATKTMRQSPTSAAESAAATTKRQSPTSVLSAPAASAATKLGAMPAWVRDSLKLNSQTTEEIKDSANDDAPFDQRHSEVVGFDVYEDPWPSTQQQYALPQDTMIVLQHNKMDTHSSHVLSWASPVLAQQLKPLPGSEGGRFRLDIPHGNANEWNLLKPFFEPVRKAAITVENLPILLPWFHHLKLSLLLKECDAILLSQGEAAFTASSLPSTEEWLDVLLLAKICCFVDDDNQDSLSAARTASLECLQKYLNENPIAVCEREEVLEHILDLLCNFPRARQTLWTNVAAYLPSDLVVLSSPPRQRKDGDGSMSRASFSRNTLVQNPLFSYLWREGIRNHVAQKKAEEKQKLEQERLDRWQQRKLALERTGEESEKAKNQEPTTFLSPWTETEGDAVSPPPNVYNPPSDAQGFLVGGLDQSNKKDLTERSEDDVYSVQAQEALERQDLFKVSEFVDWWRNWTASEQGGDSGTNQNNSRAETSGRSNPTNQEESGQGNRSEQTVWLESIVQKLQRPSPFGAEDRNKFPTAGTKSALRPVTPTNKEAHTRKFQC